MTAMLENKPVTFELEPFHEVYSSLFGGILLYAPEVPASEYGSNPWRVVSKHGSDGIDSPAVEHVIHPSHLKFAMNHFTLLGPQHLWSNDTA